MDDHIVSRFHESVKVAGSGVQYAMGEAAERGACLYAAGFDTAWADSSSWHPDVPPLGSRALLSASCRVSVIRL